MRTIASIEARMGSSRLPSKVLANIDGIPGACTRLVRRLRRCTTLDGIVLAGRRPPTPTTRSRAWARGGARSPSARQRGGRPCASRRSAPGAAELPDVIVGITGDCTLLDAEIVDLGMDDVRENDCDVVTNARRPSYPAGTGVQLLPSWRIFARGREREFRDPAVREHVSLYFLRAPGPFIACFTCSRRALAGADAAFPA